jgi:hypothetical protein
MEKQVEEQGIDRMNSRGHIIAEVLQSSSYSCSPFPPATTITSIVSVLMPQFYLRDAHETTK